MSALCNNVTRRLSKCNWNQSCGYATGRQVFIRDWRLGLLNSTLLFSIFAYVVCYTIVVQQRYRLKALDVVGSTRLQLRIPAASYNIPAPLSPFCAGSVVPPPSGSFQPVSQWPCRYYDQYDAVDPGLEPSAMFVSTRITESNQSLPADCAEQPTYTCQYVNSGPTNTYYIGNVELMTLLIDHTFYSATLGLSMSASNMPGKILDQDGNVINPADGKSV